MKFDNLGNEIQYSIIVDDIIVQVQVLLVTSLLGSYLWNSLFKNIT